jgi:hypothetical protein
MQMFRLLLIPLLALAAACQPLTTAAHLGGLPPSPHSVANQTPLDEKAGIAVETLYTAVVKAGTLAFRTGFIQVSTNPAVKRSDFCVVVLAGHFTPTDTGSKVTALECRLRQARDLTRSAYDAGNSDSYDTAAREAIRIGKEILALLRSN